MLGFCLKCTWGWNEGGGKGGSGGGTVLAHGWLTVSLRLLLHAGRWSCAREELRVSVLMRRRDRMGAALRNEWGERIWGLLIS